MNKKEILDLKLKSMDLGEVTIKQYLKKLLITLFEEGESFSGKRPFGNSGWENDLFVPLIKHKVIDGELDEDDFIESVDSEAAAKCIYSLIRSW